MAFRFDFTFIFQGAIPGGLAAGPAEEGKALIGSWPRWASEGGRIILS